MGISNQHQYYFPIVGVHFLNSKAMGLATFMPQKGFGQTTFWQNMLFGQIFFPLDIFNVIIKLNGALVNISYATGCERQLLYKNKIKKTDI